MNTQEARNAYPELITGGVDAQWNVTGTLKCSWTTTRTVTFLAGPPNYAVGGTVRLRVHPALHDAFVALSRTFMFHGYVFGETAGGTVSCRKITGGTKTSPHAHGIAIDINPSKNPYGSSRPDELDEPRWAQLIADVKAIKTMSGHKVFKWGGDWSIDDDMHFEPTECTRAQIESGIDWRTVPGGTDTSFAKGLNETQWRILYQEGIANSSSEDALIDYWVTKAAQRTDAEYDRASASMFTEFVRERDRPGADHNHDGRYLTDVEGLK